MSPERIGYAIVGCGWVGPAHAAAVTLTPAARLVAVVDRQPEAARRLGQQFDAEAYAEYTAVLSRADIQAISICLPQRLHRAVALDALAAGKHVLCEKPMAMTVDECQTMLEAAARATRHLGMVFNYRYAPVARAARELVESGGIGRVRSVTVRINMLQTESYPPRAAWRESRSSTSGGILTHRVIHVLDFLVLLFGEPRQVAGTYVLDANGLESDAAVCLGFEHDILVTLSASTAVARTGTRIELHGTTGSLTLGDASLERNDAPVPLPEDVAVPPELSACLPFGTGHIWAVREFVDAIVANTPPLVNGLDGLRVQRVLQQLYAGVK